MAVKPFFNSPAARRNQRFMLQAAPMKALPDFSQHLFRRGNRAVAETQGRRHDQDLFRFRGGNGESG